MFFRLEEKNRESLPNYRNQEILSMDTSWSAISRGATLSGAIGRGLTEHVPKVDARVSRFSYGWTASQRFNPIIHDRRDKTWDNIEECWMADNQMQWAIKRVSWILISPIVGELRLIVKHQGQNISALNPKTFKYYRVFSIFATGIKSYEDEIFTSAEAHPSSRLDDTIKHHSTIKYNTPRPVEEMAMEKMNRRSVFEWIFEFSMQLSGASLSISVIDAEDGEVASKSLTIAAV